MFFFFFFLSQTMYDRMWPNGVLCRNKKLRSLSHRRYSPEMTNNDVILVARIEKNIHIFLFQQTRRRAMLIQQCFWEYFEMYVFRGSDNGFRKIND